MKDDLLLLTQDWKSLAKNFIREDEIDDIISRKIDITTSIVEFLNPVSGLFIKTIMGIPNSSYPQEIANGMHIKRILGRSRYTNLTQDDQEHFTSMIHNSVKFGILTHLFLFTFPTRSNFEKVDLSTLEMEWIYDAIIADKSMGYYGSKGNPIPMIIFEYYFNMEIKPFVKQRFRYGAFRLGRCQSFFRNLYIAGALLVLKCDLSTKKVTT